MMDKGKMKQYFRVAMTHTPLWVHKIITRHKVRSLTEYIMPEEQVIRCEEDTVYRDTAVKERMAKFPAQAKKMNKYIEHLFNTNPGYRSKTAEEKKRIIADMQLCWFGYGFQIDEYVFFDLNETNKGYAKRRQLVSDAERLAFRFCANDFTNAVYSDKASAYEKLKPYYKRSVAIITGEKDRDTFMAFVKDRDRFVQKEVSSSRGQGVKLVDLKAYPGGAAAYFEKAKNAGKMLLEEEIIQSEQMKRFNPDSVNTVRLSTFYTRDGIVAPFGFFRTGRKGSFIDNCATGGVFSTIDAHNGVVCSDSCDEFGNRFAIHPDSKLPLNGFKLPEWDKAVKLCKEAAALTPDLKYLSWDLAYSEKYGWEIVEVNTSGQFMQQAGTLTGIRTELKAIIDNMDLLIPFTLRA